MIFLIRKNPYKSSIILFFVSCVLIAYFLIQMFNGEYSADNISEKSQKLNSLILQYEKNQFDIRNYEAKIKSLDTKNLDIDSLETEMRDKLLYTKPNEILLIIPDDPEE